MYLPMANAQAESYTQPEYADRVYDVPAAISVSSSITSSLV